MLMNKIGVFFFPRHGAPELDFCEGTAESRRHAEVTVRRYDYCWKQSARISHAKR